MKQVFSFSFLSKRLPEIGKYTFTSLLATTCDFTVFYLLLAVTTPTLLAMLAGQIAGSILSFGLQYRWVFDNIDKENMRPLVLKYIVAQLLSTALNIFGVWFLIYLIQTSPWLSRILIAIFVWVMMYLVNKFLVFQTLKSVRLKSKIGRVKYLKRDIF